MRVTSFVIASVAVVFACGSGAGSADGSVAGVSLQVADATFYDDPSNGTTDVSIVDVTDICGYFSKAHFPDGMRDLEIELRTVVGNDGFVLAPGTFPVGGIGASAHAAFGIVTCAGGDGSVASAGGVTVTAVTSAALDGTFDLTFGQDRLTGTFHAIHCVRAYDANGNENCVPHP